MNCLGSAGAINKTTGPIPTNSWYHLHNKVLEKVRSSEHRWSLRWRRSFEVISTGRDYRKAFPGCVPAADCGEPLVTLLSTTSWVCICKKEELYFIISPLILGFSFPLVVKRFPPFSWYFIRHALSTTSPPLSFSDSQKVYGSRMLSHTSNIFNHTKKCVDFSLSSAEPSSPPPSEAPREI